MERKKLVVVITGASSGIGRATALEFASLGHTVVLAARRTEALAQLKLECEEAGGRALAVPTDVSIEAEVNRLASTAIKEFGRIDVWVNNAAVSLLGKFEEIPIEHFRRVIETNLFGYIYGARSAVSVFKDQKSGTLINVASIVGVLGQPFSAPYNISKFGIRGLSLSLEQELADLPDVHVCSVLPSSVDTPLFNHAANFMGKAIKAPQPVIPAEDVAKEIVRLTEHPKAEVFVGSSGVKARVAKFFAPSAFDKKYRQKTLKEHFKDVPVEVSEGNLYRPIDDITTESGGWMQEEKGGTTGKKIAAAAAVAGALAGLAWLGREKFS
ncbi:MAG TPA: SDR family oxidoreductase [Cytophagaceae bacterium]